VILGDEVTAVGYVITSIGLLMPPYVASVPLLRQWHAGRLYERAVRNKWDVDELVRVIEAISAQGRRWPRASARTGHPPPADWNCPD
jgi:hypothetical protein